MGNYDLSSFSLQKFYISLRRLTDCEHQFKTTTIESVNTNDYVSFCSLLRHLL